MALHAKQIQPGPVAQMVGRYLAKRATSQSQLALQAGCSRRAIRCLLDGVDSKGSRYLGIRRSTSDQEGLLFRVAKILEVPNQELRKAIYAEYEVSGP